MGKREDRIEAIFVTTAIALVFIALFGGLYSEHRAEVKGYEPTYRFTVVDMWQDGNGGRRYHIKVSVVKIKEADKWWVTGYHADPQTIQEAKINGSWYRELHVGSTWTGHDDRLFVYDHNYR